MRKAATSVLLLGTLLVMALVLASCQTAVDEDEDQTISGESVEEEQSGQAITAELTEGPTEEGPTEEDPVATEGTTVTSDEVTREEPETTPVAEPEPAPESEETEASDSVVTIVLDRLERADTMCPDVVEALSSTSRPYEPPAPDTGSDYVCVYLTITRIEDVHMVDGLGHGDEETVLVDGRGQEYEPVAGQLQGIRFMDTSDIRSPIEVVEGATVFWVFEVPKDETPSELKFVYSFKEDWGDEEETEKRAQLDLLLP